MAALTAFTPTKPAGRPIKNSQLFGLLDNLAITDNLVSAIALESDETIEPITVKARAQGPIVDNLVELNYRGIRFTKGEKSDKSHPEQVYVTVTFDHSRWNYNDDSVQNYMDAVENDPESDVEQMYASLKTKIVLLCRALAKKVIAGKENHFRLYAAYVVWQDLKTLVVPNVEVVNDDFDSFNGSVDCVQLLNMLARLKEENGIDVTTDPGKFPEVLKYIKTRAAEQEADADMLESNSVKLRF